MGPRPRRALCAALATLGALAGGCTWDGPRSTLAPRSYFARTMLDVYGIITWASIGVALVSVVLGWVLLSSAPAPTRRRQRRPAGTAFKKWLADTIFSVTYTSDAA